MVPIGIIEAGSSGGSAVYIIDRGGEAGSGEDLG